MPASTWNYDLASNVTRRVQTLTGNTFAGTYNYTYDEANRLKTVAGPAALRLADLRLRWRREPHQRAGER